MEYMALMTFVLVGLILWSYRESISDFVRARSEETKKKDDLLYEKLKTDMVKLLSIDNADGNDGETRESAATWDDLVLIIKNLNIIALIYYKEHGLKIRTKRLVEFLKINARETTKDFDDNFAEKPVTFTILSFRNIKEDWDSTLSFIDAARTKVS